jgi:adenosylcobinamide kinase / adenosylcobinamide-phosphate guanylyltransferase
LRPRAGVDLRAYGTLVVEMDTTSAHAGPRRVLILGGARSGKSTAAEARLAASPDVTYVATSGSQPGDEEWATRVAAHRARRPSHWRTVETSDVATVLGTASGAVLVDCLTLWLADVMSRSGAWEDTAWHSGAAATAVGAELDALVAAWRKTTAYVVAVSNEVGMGVVPATASGRRFRDELGRLNMRLAEAADEVLLVVAGRVVAL